MMAAGIPPIMIGIADGDGWVCILRSVRRCVTSQGMKHFAAERLVFLGLAIFALAGCVTNKIDWAGRIGNYTHDQAILELGPPDKQATLTDGVVVAEWLTRRGRAAVYATGPGYFGYPGGPGYYSAYYPPYFQPGSPDYFLRLTFGADGKLTAWQKFVR